MSDLSTSANKQKPAIQSLRLLVVQDGVDEQTFETTSRNLSIGSGAACNLKLSPENAAELQCQILRGLQKTIIRSLALDTQLNGETFNETWMTEGDTITFGNTTLTVVSLGHGDPSKTAKHSPVESRNKPLCLKLDGTGVEQLKRNVEMASSLRNQLELGKVRSTAELNHIRQLLDAMVHHATTYDTPPEPETDATEPHGSDRETELETGEVNCLAGTFEESETADEICSNAIEVEVVERFDDEIGVQEVDEVTFVEDGSNPEEATAEDKAAAQIVAASLSPWMNPDVLSDVIPAVDEHDEAEMESEMDIDQLVASIKSDIEKIKSTGANCSVDDKQCDEETGLTSNNQTQFQEIALVNDEESE